MAKNTKVKEIYPLSPMQEGMLFHKLLGKDENAYFEQTSFRIIGSLELELFEKSINKLIERYDVLRTLFIYENQKKPLQVVFKEAKAKIWFEDISALASSEKIAFIKKFKEKDIDKGFNLSREISIRTSIIKTDEENYIFILSFHHIILDGWSIPIIFNDLMYIYNALKENMPLKLRKVNEYSNYIKWLEKQDKKEALLYWAKYLEDYEQQAQVQQLAKSVKEDKYINSDIKFIIDKETTNKLEDIARKNKATVNTVFQTIWGILLQRYNNVNDVVFGTVVSGRPVEIDGIENMVGLFINTVPVRIKSSADKSFIGLLKEVQDDAIKSKKYEYVPLAEVQSNTSIKQQLIDNIMIFENYPVIIHNNPENSKKLEFELKLEKTVEQTNYNFNIIIEMTDEIFIKLNYNESIYDDKYVNMIAGHIKHVIKEVVDNPEIKISEIEMLPEEEKTKIVVDFNNTKTEYPNDKTIHELFEEQVEKTPDNIAVVYEDKQLTYKELNEKANQLARMLREKGVRSDSIVGIMVERSLDMIVGIMGILKAGGAYLPIDPEYPQERIEYMLEDSNTKILLTQNYVMDKAKFDGIIVNVEDGEIYEGNKDNLKKINKPSNLAYVIYTSGSTGKPKGVMVEHRNIVNTILSRKEEYNQTSKDYVMIAFSFSFDAFVTSFFTPIISGSKTLLLNKEVAKDFIAILRKLTSEKITHFITIPSLYMGILQSADNVMLQNLKVVTLGGEKLTLSIIKKCLEIAPKAEIVNEYGPTENSVLSTMLRNVNLETSISVGKPISNTRIYIVNENNRIQPIGVAGELCISGKGLARGYLNRQELTEEKFIPNPFETGERMYRTGDLARWMPDGNIEFIGRIDHQIKIRGFRIELGEIENQLLKHEDVKEAVVVDREDKEGNKYLCAYITGGREITVTELREHLSKKLPDYMIPVYFIRIEKMPLTPNGKLDRKALPEPDGEINTGVEYAAPTNEIEEKLAKVWTEVLGVEKIGIDDDFFVLGGHSLKAIQVVSMIHRELNVEVTVGKVFSNPTIRQVGEYIGKSKESIYSSIKAVEEREVYKTSSAQKRLFALNQFGKEETNYNLPSVMVVEGKLEKEKVEEAFRKLVKRHEAFRTSFELENEEIVQRIHKQVEFNVEYMGLNETGEELIKGIVESFIKPFELSKAPLLRVKLVMLKEEKYILMMDMHHIISDGISMGIIMEEFSKIYKGEELEELKIQYKDYSAWQNETLTSENIKKQEEYWMKVFRDEIPVLDIPTDYQRPTMQSFEGETIGFKIDKYLAEKIKKIGKNNGTTLYMTLLSTYNILLSRYSGQEDIIVGSAIAGRPHADLQRIVGMFVNTLAMRNYPKADKTFKEFLQNVKKNALSAYENQDYQFDALVEKLDIRKDLSRTALFDTMFVLQNIDAEGMDIDNLKINPYNFEYKMSKFDITLSAMEVKEEIAFNLEYCTKLFKRETIERLIGHFINILKEVVENPEIKISEIDMLLEEEKTKILVDFNDTKTEYPKDKTIHELFEEQVEKSPDNIAVVFEDEKLTYRELNEKANSLARILREKGVEPNTVVGIMVERSIEMIVGILSILKAGGAYLPIDQEYPDERIRYMLEDSNTKILLTQNHLLVKVKFDGIIVDLEDGELYKGNKDNLKNINKSNDLAYVIYTSGSTGKPKGSKVIHYNVNRVVKNTNYINITEEDTMLQLSNYAFDGSVFDIYGALLNGAKLILIKKETITDIHKLGDILINKKVSIFFITTALFNTLVDNKIECFRYIRKVLFGGERISISHARKALAYMGPNKIVHVYGPTESTVFATYYDINNINENDENIPIGSPIANTKIYIIEKNNVLSAIGIPGEIYIAGDGLIDGYLNNEELTAEKFRENPFVAGERIYNTGDLGRWLPDGNIEFIGRIDHQVKIRGFRIELGEIESQLLKQENIRESVVVDREDKQGNKYLCAYIACDKEMTVPELRDCLSKELPDYMIPAYFMQIKKMPLTPNGKIDRKALPEPDGEINTGVEYATPRNEIEEKLVKVWSEVLGVERIGIDDDFFTLGGDSIKAIRMISKLREYGYEIGIRNIIRDRTIRVIRTGISKLEISTVEQSEIVGEVALTPIQITVFKNKLEVPNHFNQSFILESKERIKQESLIKALTTIVEHHDILRAVYKDDVLIIRPISENNLYDFKYYDFSDVKEEETLYRKIDENANEMQSSINLSTGPLMKVGVFCTEYKDYLFICIHHLVVDGVSWRIILEDLSRGYLASKEKKEIILPAKTVSFKKWSETLRKYRESNALKKEIVYWKEIEQKVKESKMVSTVNKVEHGIENVIVHLTSEQTNDLLYKAGRAYETEINELLLTALFRAVNKVTGMKSVSVSMEGHGREPIGVSTAIDRTVGWFTSVYPVAINGIGETIAKDICEIKETLRKIPNHGIGYGVLRVLGDEVIDGIEPDITFNYLGEFVQENYTEDFLLSNIPRGQEISEKNKFGTPITVNGAIVNKELDLIINYNKERFSKSFMEDFKRQYEKQLLDIIEHCVKVKKRDNIEANGLEMNSGDNNFDINQFIWSRFSIDSILKVISVDNQAYSILFVENMDQKIRNEIINTLIEKLSLEYMPHYCINMDKYQLSQSTMDEKMFREMCSDNNSLSNKDLLKIELENFNNNLNNKIIDQYIASCMQKSFLEASGAIIEEVITIDGLYTQDKIMEVVKVVVQEQSVLRSSYEKCDIEYIVSEHKYDTSWYIPYIDLRYASYEYITTINKDIYGMKNGEGNCDSRNNLIRIVITRESEVCHKIHIIAHHSGWDKASTQILNDRLNELIKSNSTKTLIKATYKSYIEEIKNCNGFTNDTEYMAELKIKDFIENVNEYVQDNIENNLEKSILLTIKMGPKLLKVLKEKPWNLLTHVLRIVARENQLISQDKTSIPMFILQEDRRGKEKNYVNTMGEFLDILPILVDCSQDVIKCDMQKYVEKVQNIKKDKNINYLALFNREQQDFYLLTTSVLSINYHGIFELTYDIVQKMLSLDNLKGSTEIFVNFYSNYLIVSSPIYRKCSNNLEKVLQDEFDILETKLS